MSFAEGDLNMQDAVRADEYQAGSPHLIHRELHGQLTGLLRRVILDRLAATGTCRVLEVGAGDGTFTDRALAAGATVLATEMNIASFSSLRARLAYNPRATVLFDPDGQEVFRRSDRFDVVLCISVLHHIPDYLGFLRQTIEQIDLGGALLSYQDPLYYPRRSPVMLRVERAAYLAWRVWRGDLGRGMATQLRRWRGIRDESLPGDMVEYHVVRQGLDEQAIEQLLSCAFSGVSLLTYWSTPSRLLQAIGRHVLPANTFGVIAEERCALPYEPGPR